MSEDLSIIRLKVAYAFHVAQMIMEADDNVDPREMVRMTEAFPRELLDGLNFVDEHDSFTTEFYDALDEAAEVLPFELSLREKLALVAIFARVTGADGEMDERERELLIDAAEFLGVPRSDVVKSLNKLG